MFNEFFQFLADLTGGLGRSNGEKSAMTFFFVFMCSILSGLACLLFFIFAAHGLYTNDELSVVTKNFSTACKLGLVALASGFVASRWFRVENHIDKDN